MHSNGHSVVCSCIQSITFHDISLDLISFILSHLMSCHLMSFQLTSFVNSINKLDAHQCCLMAILLWQSAVSCDHESSSLGRASTVGVRGPKVFILLRMWITSCAYMNEHTSISADPSRRRACQKSFHPVVWFSNSSFTIHHPPSTPSTILIQQHHHPDIILTSHHRFGPPASQQHQVKVVKGYDYRPISRHPPPSAAIRRQALCPPNTWKSMKPSMKMYANPGMYDQSGNREQKWKPNAK
jgi:hypothetical protein